MIPYNTAYDPPAPFVTIQVSPVNQHEPTSTVECLLDTGADVSLIPQSLTAELNLAPEDAILVEGFDGQRQQLQLFAVDIVVEDIHLNGLEVAAYPTNHAILGRDILNRFRLLLDGPAQRQSFCNYAPFFHQARLIIPMPYLTVTRGDGVGVTLSCAEVGNTESVGCHDLIPTYQTVSPFIQKIRGTIFSQCVSSP